MQKSILQLAEQLRTKAVSPVELTQECLVKIEKLNPQLHAFITVTAGSALNEAQQAETEIGRGDWRGPLHGIPISLKDIIDTAGVRTTAASAMFKDRVPEKDAEVVRRLKGAGAIFLGKQNLHEFAYGGSSIISYYGEVRNAWNPDHIAGGSSGGSATAVAAGLGYGAIGTDTAGSVREPSSQTGVVGLKPTLGRVSSRGVIPLAPSFDHVGPITKYVADAAVILQTIAGHDAEDPVSVDSPLQDYVGPLNEKLKRLNIGVPRNFFFEGLDAEVAKAVEDALEVLAKIAGPTRDLNFDVPTQRKLQSAESYAFHNEYMKRNPELYQAETLRRLKTGAEIDEKEVAERRELLAKFRREIGKVFEEVDVLVTPTTPVPAPSIAELKENLDSLRERELLLLRNTRPFNVWGLPAISVPCGFTNSGLPIGLQIAGPHWEETRILQIAHAYEQATEWHKRTPAIAS